MLLASFYAEKDNYGSLSFQAIPPLEFMVKNERISLAFVEAVIHKPVVAKGTISQDLSIFPAECRGRRCSYRGKLVVGTLDLVLLKQNGLAVIC